MAQHDMNEGKRALSWSEEDFKSNTTKSWFFGIGINSYPDPIKNLQNARKDVEDILSVLEENYEIDESLLLFNEAATRGAIIDNLQRLDEETGKEGTEFLQIPRLIWQD